MRIKSIILDDDIWGKIEDYYMPYPGVYQVNAKNETGLVIAEDIANKILSKKAISYATKIHNGLIYFDWYGTGRAARYEVLKIALKNSMDSGEQTYLHQQIQELQSTGRADFPEYFGECPPPSETPIGIVHQFFQITNGVYLVVSHEKVFFAINSIIAESKLTSTAQYLCYEKSGYLFFDEFASAAPIFELYYHFGTEYKNAIDLIGISWDVVFATLHQNFRTYVLLMEEEGELIQTPTENVFAQAVVSFPTTARITA